MVTGKTSHFSCAANFLRGRKCVFCGSFKVCKTGRGYVKCAHCGKAKSLTRLRREIAILRGFYQLQPAYRLAHDVGLDIKVVTRVYQRLREVLYHVTELEGGKLKGEIELDEAYFGGKRKGKRGPRGSRQKRRIWLAGARWASLHPGRRIRERRRTDVPYPGQNPQGLGLLHRCLSRLSVPQTLREASYG